MENKTIEQGVDQIYGESNDPVNVRKKVAFIQGAKWIRDELMNQIEKDSSEHYTNGLRFHGISLAEIERIFRKFGYEPKAPF